MIIHTNIKRNKKKTSKSASILAAEAALRATLARCGYRGGSKSAKKYNHDLGIQHRDYTNDSIPGNGTAKDAKTYTGTEIAGIATMHKSNAVPIRRDNKSAAIDISSMRR